MIQDTWTASGDFMQYLWQDKVLPVIGEDEWVHYVWGTPNLKHTIIALSIKM